MKGKMKGLKEKILTIIILFFNLSIGISSNITLTRGSDALNMVPLIDGHNDLPGTLYSKVNNDLSKFPFEKNLTEDKIWGSKACILCQTDLPRLLEGKIGAQFWSAYVDCKTQYKDAVTQTLQQIDVIKRFVKKYPKYLEFVTAADDIETTWKKRKIASLIGVEGGHSIDSSLAILRLYHELGVRYLTLTHSCDTPWADSSPSISKSVVNLTDFGKIIVWEMNRLGMLVDLSHVSHNVMREVLNITKAPVIFSHSSVYSICDHHRNVPDDVLIKLKENKGIVMINFYPLFINCNKTTNVTIEHIVAHINYIRKLVGVDYIGIGSDFNGIPEVPIGLEDVSKFPALFDRLYESKKDEPEWSLEDLKKLAGKNLIRVFKAVENVRDSLVSQKPYEDIISMQELKVAYERVGLQLETCKTLKEYKH